MSKYIIYYIYIQSYRPIYQASNRTYYFRKTIDLIGHPYLRAFSRLYHRGSRHLFMYKPFQCQSFHKKICGISSASGKYNMGRIASGCCYRPSYTLFLIKGIVPTQMPIMDTTKLSVISQTVENLSHHGNGDLVRILIR